MRTITTALAAIAVAAMTVASAWSAPKQQPQPQFDPPRCVSGADTYCQPIGSSPPPTKLPANIPQ